MSQATMSKTTFPDLTVRVWVVERTIRTDYFAITGWISSLICGLDQKSDPRLNSRGPAEPR